MKLIPIKEIKKTHYEGKIYDLEVKNSHTYNINHVVVGNCSIGLHGVGTKAVNALSDKFVVTVKREGNIYRQEFSEGNPTTEVEIIGKCEKNDTGTTIQYHPDKKIFKLNLDPNCKDLQNRISELASLNAGLTFNYKNNITKVNKKFVFEDGIIGYTKRMSYGKNLLYDDPISFKGDFKIEDNKIIIVEIAFIHDDESESNTSIKTFANNVNTYEGGFHLNGFKKAYQKVINNYGMEKKLISTPIEIKYLLDGMYAVVSVKVPNAEFEGQTKTKLGNAEAQTAVEEVLTNGFENLIKNNKNIEPILEAIVVRAAKVKEAEEEARRTRMRKRSANKASKMALPGKLADCENKTGYSELFLVEGDSAKKDWLVYK